MAVNDLIKLLNYTALEKEAIAPMFSAPFLKKFTVTVPDGTSTI